MSGAIKGVQKEIRAVQPLAVYTHCVAHRLSLALMKAINMRQIINMHGTLQTGCAFFSRSANRASLLARCVASECPEATARRLKPLCMTRWVERHDTVIVFLDLLPAVIAALQEVAGTAADTQTVATANGMLAAVTTSSFVFCLVACVATFAITLELSRHLQTPNMNASRDRYDTDVYDLAVARCSELGIEVSTPRVVGRQVHRSNVPADGSRDHYRKTCGFH